MPTLLRHAVSQHGLQMHEETIRIVDHHRSIQTWARWRVAQQRTKLVLGDGSEELTSTTSGRRMPIWGVVGRLLKDTLLVAPIRQLVVKGVAWANGNRHVLSRG